MLCKDTKKNFCTIIFHRPFPTFKRKRHNPQSICYQDITKQPSDVAPQTAILPVYLDALQVLVGAARAHEQLPVTVHWAHSIALLIEPLKVLITKLEGHNTTLASLQRNTLETAQ